MISGELLKIRRPLISNIVSSIVGIACNTLLRLYFTAQKVAVFGVILVRIFSTFGVHTEVYLRIQSEGGKIRTKLLFTTVNHVRFSTVYNVIKSANSRYHIRWVFPSMHCTTSITRDFSQAQAFFCHHQVCFLILELSFILHFLLRILIFYQDHHFLLEAHLLRILNMCPHQLNFVFFLWLCSIQSYWASQSSIY